MHNNVLNEYILDTGTLSKTDWVVTFPTKDLTTCTSEPAPQEPPFQRNFNPAIGTGLRRRQRRRSGTAKSASAARPPVQPPDFSPKNPTETPGVPSLCYEANVVTFNAVGVSGTTVVGVLAR